MIDLFNVDFNNEVNQRIQTTEGLVELANQISAKLKHTPISQLPTKLSGNELNIILVSILKDIQYLFNLEGITSPIYVEKYFVLNDNPKVKYDFVKYVEYEKYDNIKEEMLEVFDKLGIENGIKLYLIIAYHLEG